MIHILKNVDATSDMTLSTEFAPPAQTTCSSVTPQTDVNAPLDIISSMVLAVNAKKDGCTMPMLNAVIIRNHAVSEKLWSMESANACQDGQETVMDFVKETFNAQKTVNIIHTLNVVHVTLVTLFKDHNVFLNSTVVKIVMLRMVFATAMMDLS